MIHYVFLLDELRDKFIMGKPERLQKSFQNHINEIITYSKTLNQKEEHKDYISFNNDKVCYIQYTSKNVSINVIADKVEDNKLALSFLFEFIEKLNQQIQVQKELGRKNRKFRKNVKQFLQTANNKITLALVPGDYAQKHLKLDIEMAQSIQTWEMAMALKSSTLEIKEKPKKKNLFKKIFKKPNTENFTDPTGIKRKMKIALYCVVGFLLFVVIVWLIKIFTAIFQL